VIIGTVRRERILVAADLLAQAENAEDASAILLDTSEDSRVGTVAEVTRSQDRQVRAYNTPRTQFYLINGVCRLRYADA